ncbi:DUF819 family protein [Facklamia sp. DSM 111018]|uniref:DUF819 family protein n=1 Tax=Facklamia lactis TaxID=2749967 RepID=A0ABS0LS84_9LACT|nr:DUF819 family protein [Facklamia lactis]MBG9980533.1 DUF819 family protein [Facklamia lactis]MBG9986325.1 DUF819 family protein [Facklamia lactis]
MEALITRVDGLLFVILFMVSLSLWLQKYKIFKSLGPVLTVVVLGIILSNTGVVPISHDVYGTLASICVPVSISICMLSMNLAELKKLTKKPFIALASGIFSVMLVATLLGIFFAPRMDEGWKVAGMFVGTYTGGTPNLTAIATGLDATRATIAAANAADYVVSTPLMIFMFAAPAILKASEKWNKFWPYQLSTNELETGDKEPLMSDKKWSIRDIAWLLTIGFGVTYITTTLSEAYAPEAIWKAVRLILLTTVSIMIAQIKPVQKLRGNLDLGLFLSLTFLATIGFAVDIRQFIGSAFVMTLYVFLMLIGCLLLHLVICRLLKVEYEYMILSIVGCIVDGPTASLTAAGANWKSLINVGLIMGVIAGAAGNYVGVTVAYIIKAIIGA